MQILRLKANNPAEERILAYLQENASEELQTKIEVGENSYSLPLTTSLKILLLKTKTYNKDCETGIPLVYLCTPSGCEACPCLDTRIKLLCKSGFPKEIASNIFQLEFHLILLILEFSLKKEGF